MGLSSKIWFGMICVMVLLAMSTMHAIARMVAVYSGPDHEPPRVAPAARSGGDQQADRVAAPRPGTPFLCMFVARPLRWLCDQVTKILVASGDRWFGIFFNLVFNLHFPIEEGKQLGTCGFAW